MLHAVSGHSARDLHRAPTRRPRLPATLAAIAAAVASHARVLRPVPAQKARNLSATASALVVPLTMSGKSCMACKHTPQAVHGCMTQLPMARQASVPVLGLQLQIVLLLFLHLKSSLQSLLLKQVLRGLKPTGFTPGGRSPSLTPSRVHRSCITMMDTCDFSARAHD
jgi:hypothetical protein